MQPCWLCRPDSCRLPAANRFEFVQLPFELRVLETSLKDVTRLCTGLSREIEADANPALEALTRKVGCCCGGTSGLGFTSSTHTRFYRSS